MKWNEDILNKLETEISNIEEKKKLAERIAEKVEDGQVIGFGSGSTSYLATIAIAEKIKKEDIKIKAIPTSFEPTCAAHHQAFESFLQFLWLSLHRLLSFERAFGSFLQDQQLPSIISLIRDSFSDFLKVMKVC